MLATCWQHAGNILLLLLKIETFYQKCECCNGNGLKKTKSIVIHNLISLIKNLNSLDENETYEIRIDDQFFKDNENEIDNIPNRKIDCTSEMKCSPKRSVYVISPAEAEVLKQHPKISHVERSSFQE